MTQQYSDAERTAEGNARVSAIGINAQIRILSGAIPANVAAAETGTLLAQYTGNATQYGTVATGVITTSAVANTTALAAGTAGYFRIRTSAGVAVSQGTAYQRVTIATSALTAANSNVLNFAATTGVAVGQAISGAGVPNGATVIAFTGTTVTMSLASTAGVASAASIVFGGDMTFDNATFTLGQTLVFTSRTETMAGA
jgi:hypothetical protein